MNIREKVVMLAIIAILISAAICLRDNDNEIRSDRSIKDNNIEKEPGFKAVFTVVVLLAAACFFSRRRKKKEKDEKKDNERGHG